jgi:hypothetical protein
MSDPLDGLSGPRPLSPALRGRLEDAILAGAARPLTPAQDAELSELLRVQELLSDLETPRPVPASVRAAIAARPRHRAPLVGAAAAVLVGAAVAVALLPTAGTPPGPAVAGPAVTVTGKPGAFLFRGGPQQTYRLADVVGGRKAVRSLGKGVLESSARIVLISPSTGPAQGGTWVTLTGYGFEPGTTVTFGGRPAARVQVLSATVVRALSPQHLSGVALVQVDGSNLVPFVYL